MTVENYQNSIRYAGEFYDAETGLYYLRARYYDPYIGRFISEDSYWGEDTNPLSLNLYTYCYNDPIQHIDPTGHWGGKAGERDDTKLSEKDQKKIKDLTDKYFSTKDKKERDEIHKEAEKIRDEAAKKGTMSKDNSDSFGKAANEKIKKNKEEKGRSYMSADEWKKLSKEHERRSGGESPRDKSKSIEKEIKEITQKKERSSDYKIGSKGYYEDVERIKKTSGAREALSFVIEDRDSHRGEFDRISENRRETFSKTYADLAVAAHEEGTNSWISGNYGMEPKGTGKSGITINSPLEPDDIFPEISIKLTPEEVEMLNDPAFFLILNKHDEHAGIYPSGFENLTPEQQATALKTYAQYFKDNNKAEEVYIRAAINGALLAYSMYAGRSGINASEGAGKSLSGYGVKSESYLTKRGWTWDSAQDVVGNPYTTREAVNKATGNSATVFYNQSGDYVVRDNITGELVQTSKFGDVNWIPDSSIINPYKP